MATLPRDDVLRVPPGSPVARQHSVRVMGLTVHNDSRGALSAKPTFPEVLVTHSPCFAGDIKPHLEGAGFHNEDIHLKTYTRR